MLIHRGETIKIFMCVPRCDRGDFCAIAALIFHGAPSDVPGAKLLDCRTCHYNAHSNGSRSYDLVSQHGDLIAQSSWGRTGIVQQSENGDK